MQALDEDCKSILCLKLATNKNNPNIPQSSHKFNRLALHEGSWDTIVEN